MKGYKAFNKDLQCRGMQYEIGGTYELGDTPVCCKKGFHFCKSISDCYNFYDMTDETRICEVEALGDVVTSDEIKYCTNKICVIREVENTRIKSNTNETCTGFCNSGSWNRGNGNSGYMNSGNRNTGDYNSGSWNSGHRNSGNYNNGYMNSGNRNTGDYNSGNRNSGDFNSGYYNSGDYNSGSRNSGNRNSGDFNSGYYNSGDYNSGVFNTEKIPTIKMFDKDSNWTINDWYKSKAYRIMDNSPVKAEDRQKWWNDLSDSDKRAVMSLPNFNADKFYQCTKIRVET